MRALAILLLLAGCASQPQPTIIDTACSWVKVLTFSPQDTPQTKREIIAHDKAVRKNCP